MFTTITNKKQKKQINEFIDKDHSVMDKYYEFLDKDLPDKQYIANMRKLIEIDEDFYDPYLIIADILSYNGKTQEAQALVREAYERAVKRIADAQGRWPQIISWGFLGNRHLMRTIETYADDCWNQGNIDEALDIYRRLLRLNPQDNQGARYNILAIKMGLASDKWEKPFEVKHNGEIVGLDAFKISAWFNKNAKKFPDEFDWLFQFHEQE